MEWNSSMSMEFWQDLNKIPPAVSARVNKAVTRMITDPWAKELHPEKVKSAEVGIYSCRADDKYRIIWKHIKPNDIVFCLVDKHDPAYQRATRKSFTLDDGIVKIKDITQVDATRTDATGALFEWARKGDAQYGKLFVGYKDQELLDFGVPEEVLPNIRALDNTNQLEEIERLLPEEVFYKLVEIALNVVDHPLVGDGDLRESLERNQGGEDLYRFLDSEEFKRALAGDMEDWMLFLAPPQRYLIIREYNGPARVKGVSGSGKTVVAIHRARHLAKRAQEKGQNVLFLTYGNRLPGVIMHLLKQLAGEDAPELSVIECQTIHQWCSRFLRSCGDSPLVDNKQIPEILGEAIEDTKSKFPGSALWKRPRTFFQDEIRYAIKGRAISNLDEYLQIERSGRGTALREAERRIVFEVYKAYQEKLRQVGLCDFDDFVLDALKYVQQGKLTNTYSYAVIDEIQDLTEATLKLIRAMVEPGINDLFLVGDGLQRIYPGGNALSRINIDVTGRGTLLRKNYRNTQEILRTAHAMMKDIQYDDLDDEQSLVTDPEYSLRHGDNPFIKGFPSPEEEIRWISKEISNLKESNGYKARDFAILYRYRNPYLDLVTSILGQAQELVEINENPDTYFGPGIKHTTFHSAKGLEFKVVFIVGVTDGRFVPRDEWTLNGEELADYLSLERRILYVAMTRARDRLYTTYSRGQPSRFLRSVPRAYFRSE